MFFVHYQPLGFKNFSPLLVCNFCMQQYNSCMHVHLILWRFKLWNGDGGCRAIYTFFCDTGLFRSLLHITPKEAVWQWKPMPWSSWRTLFVLMLMPGEVWTLQLLSQQYALFTGWPCSATLDGLPLYCWVTMISKCFQFAITALTVNCRGKNFDKLTCFGGGIILLEHSDLLSCL